MQAHSELLRIRASTHEFGEGHIPPRTGPQDTFLTNALKWLVTSGLKPHFQKHSATVCQELWCTGQRWAEAPSLRGLYSHRRTWNWGQPTPESLWEGITCHMFRLRSHGFTCVSVAQGRQNRGRSTRRHELLVLLLWLTVWIGIFCTQKLISWSVPAAIFPGVFVAVTNKISTASISNTKMKTGLFV